MVNKRNRLRIFLGFCLAVGIQSPQISHAQVSDSPNTPPSPPSADTDSSPSIPEQTDDGLYEPNQEKVEAVKKGPQKSAERISWYSVQPSGEVLYEGLMRVRLPYSYVTGSSGFDEDREKQDLGFELEAAGTALVVEYGLTDKLSLQFYMPYVLKNELGLNAGKFRDSATYKNNYNHFASELAALLNAEGICDSTESCRALIASGYKLNSPKTVTLPRGETITAQPGIPLKQYIDSLVTNAAAPESGDTGIGDITLGGLYQITDGSGPFHFAVGGGLRIPTGSYTKIPRAQRPTGRGVYAIGLRTNVDYDVARGFVASWQNQFEHMIAKGEKKVYSLVTPDEVLEETMDVTRVGTRAVGYLEFKFGLGVMGEALEPYGLALSYNYDADNAVRFDGDEVTPRSYLGSATVNVNVDFVQYGIPLRFDYDYTLPLHGKNVAIATHVSTAQLKAYYLF